MRGKNGGKSNQRISRLRLAEISKSRRGEETVRAMRGRRRGLEAMTVIGYRHHQLTVTNEWRFYLIA